MFKFDQVALPQLLLRKALIVVDFQQDFVGATATLPITAPEGYADNTIRLAKAFRAEGDVIWINSKFEEVRPAYGEHLAGTLSEPLDSQDGTPDPEAFLSHERAKCVLSSKLGAEVPLQVQEDAEKNDVLMCKSHYSAFEGTGLLRVLRARMTMEVYICGSLINVGVLSTTIDAAGHGLKITIVDDCCGYSSEIKRAKAVAILQELTDCDILSSTDIIQKSAKTNSSSASSTKSKPPGLPTSQKDDLAQPMSALTLNATAPRAAEAGSMQNEATDEADGAKYKMNSNSSEVLDKKATDTTPSYLVTMNAAKKQDETASTWPDEEVSQNLCEGDTCIIENLLPPDLENGVFEKLRNEVQWQRMSHQGGEVPRLVAVQGEVGTDGSIPIYRHPSDESPPLLSFSPSVSAIKAETERQLGHPLNHVLLQFYRDGKDYISEHSDKTLDIVRGSYIANVSLGATRTMIFRTKRADKDPSADKGRLSSTSRKVQRVALSHNSLCRMGLKTNEKWLHSIRQDKRADWEKSPDELAYKGGRISLTFRHIGTFLDKDETIIWGQGATRKTRDDANGVVNGQTEESIQMLRAFGTENHASNFDWDTYYGRGFDVLHLRSAPRFFASTDAITNLRVCIMLAEYEIGYAGGSITQAKKQSVEDGLEPTDTLVKFVDNDDEKQEATGDIAIMLYLYFNHQKKKSLTAPADLARQFTLFQKSFTLSKQWHKASKSSDLSSIKAYLASWELEADATAYIGGDGPNLADFAFWPALHIIVQACGQALLNDLPRLSGYYEIMKTRPSTGNVLDRLQAE